MTEREKLKSVIENMSRIDLDLRGEKHRKIVENMLVFHETRGFLTGPQKSYFNSFCDLYTDNAIESAKEWKDSYGPEERSIAVKCAHYYIKTQYFTPLARKVLDDPGGHLLSRKEFTKMCENKYAKKILLEYESDAKYSVGQPVQVRKTIRSSDLNSLGVGYNRTPIQDRYAVVLEADCRPVTRAAKGSKVYKILCHSMSYPVFVYESDIKKARKKK